MTVPPIFTIPDFGPGEPSWLSIPNATLVDPTVDPEYTQHAWWRIEPMPLTPDVKPALQATVADPMWLLARQWQFLEFAGDDAGTPISVILDGTISPLTRYAAGPLDANATARAKPFDAEQLPLETLVEREPVWTRHPRLNAEAGLHLVRMLTVAGVAATRDAIRAAFPLNVAAATTTSADSIGMDWLAIANGRAIDAARLAAAIATARGTAATLTTLPAGLTIDTASRAKVIDVLSRWSAWFNDAVSEPHGDEAWNPRRLEYSFAAGASAAPAEMVLGSDQYADGTLDWYSVVGESATIGTPSVAAARFTAPPTMPSPVEYAGKPADRFWEFEDSNVSFGDVDAGPTDLGRLALLEFALVYGNDWFVVPIELPVGSLFHATTFTVRDTFGIDTVVAPSKNAGGTPWSVFTLGGSGVPDGAFFLAPTLPDVVESAPIEEVALFRDEMANMVWGVERRVQGTSGDSYDRTADEYQRSAQQSVTGPPPDAQLIYRLATSVPDNWIPFVPVPADGSTATNPVVQLERRVLEHTMEDGTTRRADPRGVLLRSDPTQSPVTEPALRIEEEEVPREGVIVTRSFQFGRWLGGRSVLWVGKRARIGRGEGASGLRFDTSDRG